MRSWTLIVVLELRADLPLHARMANGACARRQGKTVGGDDLA